MGAASRRGDETMQRWRQRLRRPGGEDWVGGIGVFQHHEEADELKRKRGGIVGTGGTQPTKDSTIAVKCIYTWPVFRSVPKCMCLLTATPEPVTLTIWVVDLMTELRCMPWCNIYQRVKINVTSPTFVLTSFWFILGGCRVYCSCS